MRESNSEHRNAREKQKILVEKHKSECVEAAGEVIRLRAFCQGLQQGSVDLRADVVRLQKKLCEGWEVKKSSWGDSDDEMDGEGKDDEEIEEHTEGGDSAGDEEGRQKHQIKEL